MAPSYAFERGTTASSTAGFIRTSDGITSDSNGCYLYDIHETTTSANSDTFTFGTTAGNTSITWDSTTASDILYYDNGTGSSINASSGEGWITIQSSDRIIVTGENVIYNQISKESLKHLLSQKMKMNMLIKQGGRANPLKENVSQEEIKARNTLRDLITEKEWRRYVTNGFIMVKGGQSNRWYQIFRSQRHIEVFERGNNVASICIHTDKACPPTDHVINMKVLVEIDEEAVWKGGNVHKGVSSNRAGITQAAILPTEKDLSTYYRQLKGMAA